MPCKYYLLFQLDGVVRAADASEFATSMALTILGQEFRIVGGDDTFFFWDELIDESERQVGFVFLLPTNPILRRSRLIAHSNNVSVEGEEVCIDLSPGTPHRWDCVQGFDSAVFQSVRDPADCAILMFNWSQRSAGFDLMDGVVRG